MLISEIFYSIQGEGELTGIPSVFVRTSGCNLRCNWCDTMYASWSPEGTEMSAAEIVAEVAKHPAEQPIAQNTSERLRLDQHSRARSKVGRLLQIRHQIHYRPSEAYVST